MGERGRDKIVELASSPCSLGDVDPDYAGLGAVTAATSPENLADWRKSERKRLIDGRMALPGAMRDRASQAINARLESLLGDLSGTILSAYWPFRGEPDVKPLLRKLREGGTRIALPVVVAKGQPLLFREWRAGARLERGVWNIPFPADGPEVVPDIAIAPVVGFDPRCYRLGYGGGFFDRTMEAHGCTPRLLGVGYQMQAIPTIHPQAHDIAMELVVTENGIHKPG